MSEGGVIFHHYPLSAQIDQGTFHVQFTETAEAIEGSLDGSNNIDFAPMNVAM